MPQYSMTVIIRRVAGNTTKNALMRAVDRAMGTPLMTFVECARRRDGLLFNFIAYGQMAKRVQSFLRVGDTFVIEYVPFSNEDVEEFQGEIIGMREIARYEDN